MNTKRVLTKLVPVLLALSIFAPSAFAKITYSVQMGTVELNVHIPKDYDANQEYPLIVSLHGWLTPTGIYSGFLPFRKYVDENQFILVEPHNIATLLTGMNFNRPVSLINRIKDKIRGLEGGPRRLAGSSIDWDRFYLAGHSAGARAAYIYASKKDDVAGLAILGGDGSGADLTGITELYEKPRVPTGLIHIHGTSDLIVRYSGGKSVFESYTKENGCQAIPAVRLANNISLTEGTGCDKPTYFYSVRGEGHFVRADRKGIMKDVIAKLLKLSL